MLSIGKLGAGQQSYYVENVARGIEDYYSGRGEMPGRWVGSGAVILGLDGRVDADDLRVVLAGRDPRNDAALGRMRSDRVPGFDLTFRAPKSVSVLFGLGGFATSAEVRASHDVSVDAALGYLERAACWSRRGTDGVDEVPGAGFVGAAFRHRSSRAGDPHLHTHVLVANVTAGPDSRWATLDARHLYLHAKTAGYLYEAHLRTELTRRLGVGWRPVRNGIGDLEGISDEVLRAFSRRRAEIEAEMEARGVSSARAAEVVALDTRQAKDYAVDPRSLVERWWEQAEELGVNRETIASTLDRTERRKVDDPDVEPVVAALLSADGLTARASTFDRRDVLRSWCDYVTGGAEVMRIEALADQTLGQPSVVALEANTAPNLRTRGRGRRIAGPGVGRCYSTAELLALEERLIEQAWNRRADGVGLAADDVVLDALAARPELSEDQSAMVARLTTSGRGVEVVIAAAGTGKTFALDAARDAWQREGHHVIGVALAARAAAELEATAGIRSHTIASLLAELERAERGSLSPGTVLVIDEAGMVGTRTLGRLLDHGADASVKVVLVGDPRQLPEIDAGGLLRGLGQRIEPIQLTQNRRQHEAWERAALAALRAGHVDSALGAYDEHERIVTRPTASATRDAMAADWWAASLRHDRVLMVAARWYDVDDLNSRARQRVAAAGRLSGPVLDLDGAPYQAGDRVMTLRNDRRLGVRNGTIATISAVDPNERAVTIRTDGATCHTLPAAYLDAGHLHHAYATTIHKAQGLTVDQALVLGNDALYQEAGYVALSRGRFENRIYLVDQPAETEHHGASPPREPLDALTSALRVSHSQHLAIDHRGVQPSFEVSLARRYHERELLRRVERFGPRDPSADVDALRRSRTELDEQLDDQRAQLATFSSRRPRRNRREHDAERLVTVQRVDRLTKQLGQTDRALADAHESRDIYDKYLAEHRAELERLPQVESEIGTLLAVLVASYHERPPAYLATLGPWPEGAIDRCEWMEAATTIEDYRYHQRITDPREPFGVTDRDNREQERARMRVDQALRHLGAERHRESVGMEIEI